MTQTHRSIHGVRSFSADAFCECQTQRRITLTSLQRLTMFHRLFALLFVCLGLCSLNVDAASPAGRWVGSWSSTSTGHQGALRARIRPVDSDTYRAVFAGRFAKVIPFVYPAKLERVPGTCNCYQSTTRLPLLGEYRMTATVTANQFNATFGGKKDSGVFRMSR